jgi:hypothetical protein
MSESLLSRVQPVTIDLLPREVAVLPPGARLNYPVALRVPAAITLLIEARRSVTSALDPPASLSQTFEDRLARRKAIHSHWNGFLDRHDVLGSHTGARGRAIGRGPKIMMFTHGELFDMLHWQARIMAWLHIWEDVAPFEGQRETAPQLRNQCAKWGEWIKVKIPDATGIGMGPEFKKRINQEITDARRDAALYAMHDDTGDKLALRAPRRLAEAAFFNYEAERGEGGRPAEEYEDASPPFMRGENGPIWRAVAEAYARTPARRDGPWFLVPEDQVDALYAEAGAALKLVKRGDAGGLWRAWYDLRRDMDPMVEPENRVERRKYQKFIHWEDRIAPPLPPDDSPFTFEMLDTAANWLFCAEGDGSEPEPLHSEPSDPEAYEERIVQAGGDLRTVKGGWQHDKKMKRRPANGLFFGPQPGDTSSQEWEAIAARETRILSTAEGSMEYEGEREERIPGADRD